MKLRLLMIDSRKKKVENANSDYIHYANRFIFHPSDQGKTGDFPYEF